MHKRIVLGLALIAVCQCALAQKKFFSELQVRVDTTVFTSLESKLTVGGKPVLAFPVLRADQVIDIFFYPPETGPLPRAQLLTGKDFTLIDSLRLVDSSFYKARIQFLDMARASIIPIYVQVAENNATWRHQLFELYPYIPTFATPFTKEQELFVGEEKVIDLPTTNVANIRADGVWQTQPGAEYRLTTQGNQLRLSIIATEPGQRELKITLPVTRPVVYEAKLSNELPPLIVHYIAKTSRTAFLYFDKRDVTLDFDAPRGIEVQLDRSRLLQLKKTYRVETTAEPGGVFVGELFTRSSLANDKVLAWLRPYALHKISDGYLYIKDGDELKFITNINISEKTRIARMLLRHAGGDYTDNLSVSPGEVVDIRIEGMGLEKTNFTFKDAQNVRQDSSLSTANVAAYSLQVPITLSQRNMVIYKSKDPSGYELSVKEFQNPRPLDFVTLSWGAGPMEVGKLTQPILYDKNIPELTLAALPQKIDANGKLFGKQYLIIEINIFNEKKDLIETRTLDNISIAPGDDSPRFTFYDLTDCLKGPLNLNKFLAHKTFDLPDWATIEVTVKHNPLKYGGDAGYNQKIEIYLQKHITFDIDVSFPAGLQMFSINDNKYTGLGGISLAVLPQLSFYKPNKVAKLRPYRVGMGFIALNAFDFSNSTSNNRDISAVVLGSLFPTRSGSRFSFPLYGGFGYKLRAGQFFFLFGPGIQVRL